MRHHFSGFARSLVSFPFAHKEIIQNEARNRPERPRSVDSDTLLKNVSLKLPRSDLCRTPRYRMLFLLVVWGKLRYAENSFCVARNWDNILYIGKKWTLKEGVGAKT